MEGANDVMSSLNLPGLVRSRKALSSDDLRLNVFLSPSYLRPHIEPQHRSKRRNWKASSAFFNHAGLIARFGSSYRLSYSVFLWIVL